MRRTRIGIARWHLLPALAASLVLAACGGEDGGDDASAAGGGSAGEPTGDEQGDVFTVGMTTGGHGVAWMEGQGDVAQALAELRGWDYIEYSNEGDGPTSLENAELLIDQGVDVMMTFAGDATVFPAIAERMAEAEIPVITFDINQDGWYFVGVDNKLAGRLGGEELGRLAKQEWQCQVDLVVRSEATEVTPVNEWRVGGMLEGIRNICPDIPDENVVSLESDGLVEVAQENARDVFAANPQAERILVIGINDSSVVGALQAAEQLGRDEQIMGWGQDGSLISGDDVHPKLMGSVFYFLEGYPTYAFEEILDPLAAGEEVPIGDTPDDPTVLVEPCPVTAEEAADIPGIEERIAQLAEQPEGTHMNDLFCPTG